MRRRAAMILGVGVLALGLLALTGSVVAPGHAAVLRTLGFRSPEPAPSGPPSTKEICDRVRQTTVALGPGLPQRFRDQGLPPDQIVAAIRALYQLAESELGNLRGQTTEPALEGAMAAVAAQYHDISGRLTGPAALDKVNYAPPALVAAIANANRICG